MFESLYAVIGIVTIFILGFAGVLIPSVMARLFPKYGLTKKIYFSFFNGLAAGIILAVGWIHSIPDSESNLAVVLTADNLTDQYSWYTFIALMGCLIVFTFEEVLEVIGRRWGVAGFHGHGGTITTQEKCEDDCADEATCPAHPLNEMETGVNSNSSSDSDEERGDKDKKEQNEKKVDSSSSSACDSDEESEESEDGVAAHLSIPSLTKMMCCFIGLSLHNVFVGLALGIADNDLGLFIALLFHQFFEGMGMGARIAMVNLKSLMVVLLLDLCFASVVSIAIGVGVGIKASVEKDPNTYAIIDGTFQGLSGGILVYVALVHMIRTYQELNVDNASLDYHRLSSYCGLLLGAAIMAVIGIWA